MLEAKEWNIKKIACIFTLGNSSRGRAQRGNYPGRYVGIMLGENPKCS